MNEIKLVLPTKRYKEQIEKYWQTMLKENSGTNKHGSLETNYQEDFETWLKKCNDSREGKNLPNGRVPSTQYICIRKPDNKVVGMLSIRHLLNEFLLNYVGHIGYSVAVDERNKGYGKRMLALGLKKCKKLGIDKVLVTCKDTNVASKKCILSNGGKYEDTRILENGNIKLERYWIENKT